MPTGDGLRSTAASPSHLPAAAVAAGTTAKVSPAVAPTASSDGATASAGSADGSATVMPMQIVRAAPAAASATAAGSGKKMKGLKGRSVGGSLDLLATAAAGRSTMPTGDGLRSTAASSSHLPVAAAAASVALNPAATAAAAPVAFNPAPTANAAAASVTFNTAASAGTGAAAAPVAMEIDDQIPRPPRASHGPQDKTASSPAAAATAATAAASVALNPAATVAAAPVAMEIDDQTSRPPRAIHGIPEPPVYTQGGATNFIVELQHRILYQRDLGGRGRQWIHSAAATAATAGAAPLAFNTDATAAAARYPTHTVPAKLAEGGMGAAAKASVANKGGWKIGTWFRRLDGGGEGMSQASMIRPGLDGTAGAAAQASSEMAAEAAAPASPAASPVQSTVGAPGSAGTGMGGARAHQGTPLWRMTPGAKDRDMLASISNMEAYKGKSHEELRMEDYRQGRKNFAMAGADGVPGSCGKGQETLRFRWKTAASLARLKMTGVTRSSRFATWRAPEELRMADYLQNRRSWADIPSTGAAAAAPAVMEIDEQTPRPMRASHGPQDKTASSPAAAAAPLAFNATAPAVTAAAAPLTFNSGGSCTGGDGGVKGQRSGGGGRARRGLVLRTVASARPAGMEQPNAEASRSTTRTNTPERKSKPLGNGRHEVFAEHLRLTSVPRKAVAPACTTAAASLTFNTAVTAATGAAAAAPLTFNATPTANAAVARLTSNATATAATAAPPLTFDVAAAAAASSPSVFGGIKIDSTATDSGAMPAGQSKRTLLDPSQPGQQGFATASTPHSAEKNIEQVKKWLRGVFSQGRRPLPSSKIDQMMDGFKSDTELLEFAKTVVGRELRALEKSGRSATPQAARTKQIEQLVSSLMPPSHGQQAAAAPTIENSRESLQVAKKSRGLSR
eukprot:g13070.t1